MENDAKDARKMREEKRFVRGVRGLRSKVDGEVREKSLKCTLLGIAMISNVWHANFKGLSLSLDTLTIEIDRFYNKSTPTFIFSHFSGSLVI